MSNQLKSCNFPVAVITAGFLMGLAPLQAAPIPIQTTTTATGTVPGTNITYMLTNAGGVASINGAGMVLTDNSVFQTQNGLPDFFSASPGMTLTLTFSAPIAVSHLVFGVASYTPTNLGSASAVVTLAGGTSTPADFTLFDTLNTGFGGSTGGAATYTPATGTITSTIRDQSIILGSTSNNTVTSLTFVLGPSGDAYVAFVGFQQINTVAPTFTKMFSPALVAVGGGSTLTFSIMNTNAVPLTGVAFTDQLPAGLAVGGFAGFDNVNCGAGAQFGAVGTLVSFSNGTIPAGATCTAQIAVIATSTTGLTNTTSTVTSNEAAAGGPAMATLAAILPLGITKAFGAASIALGRTTSLTLTITNPNVAAVTNVSLTDTLPAGLLVATPNGLSTTCGVPVTATAGTNLISLATVTLNPGTCTVTLNVIAIADGSQTNTTSPPSINGSPVGAAATAMIFVGDPFQVRYASNLNVGDSVVNFTNTGESSTVAFPGQNGNICVNVYAFSPDEQLISCCSCVVTPDGLNSVSANTDLISNTLTPARPTSIVVKLLATVAAPGTPGPSCNPSTAGTLANPLANGLAAWGTTIHAQPVTAGTPPTTYGVTETRFLSSTLSAAELTRITTLCGFIQTNGSGFGICRSCRLGGLGAVKE